MATDAYKKRAAFENPVKHDFNVDRPDQAYAADINDIWTQGKWLYLAMVSNGCTWKVAGWSMNSGMKSQLDGDSPRELLNKALHMQDVSLPEASRNTLAISEAREILLPIGNAPLARERRTE